MKRIIVIILLGILIISCDRTQPKPPSKPCSSVPIWNKPIITHGFDTSNFNNVSIEIFLKNSEFDSLIKKVQLKLGVVVDNERIVRKISFPKELTSDYDFRIGISSNLIYEITEMKTEWVPRFCQTFCGYECTWTSYKLNGELINDNGNIIIKNPDFEYPRDK